MKEIYRTKISLKLIIPLAVLIFGLLVLMIVQGAVAGAIIMGIVTAFVIHMIMTTYYTIDGNELFVRSGILVNTKIDINTITKVEPTNSVLSAPALSFNRLEVFYNRYDSVVISPGDNAGFIARLKEINPAIVSV